MKRGSQPSRWREFAFAFHQITYAINPAVPLRTMIANWRTIAKELRESPRQRLTQERSRFARLKTS